MNSLSVWATLVLLTLAEVALAWIRIAPAPMLALLLLVSFVKAALIAWWFMHLRVHLPKPLLVLIPTLFFFVALLLAFLPDGVRAWTMR